MIADQMICPFYFNTVFQPIIITFKIDHWLNDLQSNTDSQLKITTLKSDCRSKDLPALFQDCISIKNNHSQDWLPIKWFASAISMQHLNQK
jgi:hypothetical protein